jgi:hypothetical protein
MKVNRIVIFERNGQLVRMHERLADRPSGNGAQRRKAIKSGWQPSWVKMGQPTPFNPPDFNSYVEGSTELGAVIYNENEHVAEMARCQADQTVSDILEQIENFEIAEFAPTPVFIGHEILCWVCDEKYAFALHERHPICDDCWKHMKITIVSEWDQLSDDLMCELEAA